MIAATSMELTGGGLEADSLYTGSEFWMLSALNNCCKAATFLHAHASSISWLCEVIAAREAGFNSYVLRTTGSKVLILCQAGRPRRALTVRCDVKGRLQSTDRRQCVDTGV